MDCRTHRAPLRAGCLPQSLLASRPIPYTLDPGRDVAGAPSGSHRHGGIADHHQPLNDGLDGRPAGAGQGAQNDAPALALYPHFQPTGIPGWLDKFLEHRHRATAKFSNVGVLSPSPQWRSGSSR